MLYIQHYIKTVYFRLNIMALLLCERQQNWLRVVTVVFRTIGVQCYYFYVIYVFYVFQNPKGRDFLSFFCRVFSNYGVCVVYTGSRASKKAVVVALLRSPVDLRHLPAQSRRPPPSLSPARRYTAMESWSSVNDSVNGLAMLLMILLNSGYCTRRPCTTLSMYVRRVIMSYHILLYICNASITDWAYVHSDSHAIKMLYAKR